MDAYFHTVILVGSGANDFDNDISDHVYNTLFYIVATRNITKGIGMNSGLRVYTLPSPDPQNFIPGALVTSADKKNWINQGVDIVAIQNENIQKIEEIIANANQ